MFDGNEATEHGNDTEKPAAKVYMNCLQKFTNRGFIVQRSFETGVYTFWGRKYQLSKKNPDDKYFSTPKWKLWHLSLDIDPFSEWRGDSTDGMATLEGIPTLVVEIKCPFGHGTALYPLEPLYYHAQPANCLYNFWRMWPSLLGVHRATYSPRYGINIEAFPVDPVWFLFWYARRELRFVFDVQFPILVEKCMFEYREANPDDAGKLPNQHRFRAFLAKWKMPAAGGHRSLDRAISEASALSSSSSSHST